VGPNVSLSIDDSVIVVVSSKEADLDIVVVSTFSDPDSVNGMMDGMMDVVLMYDSVFVIVELFVTSLSSWTAEVVSSGREMIGGIIVVVFSSSTLSIQTRHRPTLAAKSSFNSVLIVSPRTSVWNSGPLFPFPFP